MPFQRAQNRIRPPFGLLHGRGEVKVKNMPQLTDKDFSGRPRLICSTPFWKSSN